jgi:hypothetical protein
MIPGDFVAVEVLENKDVLVRKLEAATGQRTTSRGSRTPPANGDRHDAGRAMPVAVRRSAHLVDDPSCRRAPKWTTRRWRSSSRASARTAFCKTSCSSSAAIASKSSPAIGAPSPRNSPAWFVPARVYPPDHASLRVIQAHENGRREDVNAVDEAVWFAEAARARLRPGRRAPGGARRRKRELRPRPPRAARARPRNTRRAEGKARFRSASRKRCANAARPTTATTSSRTRSAAARKRRPLKRGSKTGNATSRSRPHTRLRRSRHPRARRRRRRMTRCAVTSAAKAIIASPSSSWFTAVAAKRFSTNCCAAPPIATRNR